MVRFRLEDRTVAINMDHVYRWDHTIQPGGTGGQLTIYMTMGQSLQLGGDVVDALLPLLERESDEARPRPQPQASSALPTPQP